MVHECLKLPGLIQPSYKIVFRLNRFKKLLANIMFDVQSLLFVAILFEYVLRLYQPFFDVSDLLVDSVKLLPLFLRLRDDEAEIVLCAFNEVLNPFLLSLYLFHTLNDVNYDLLRLAYFFLEQSPLELIKLVLQSV